jgi:hypothetical protein
MNIHKIDTILHLEINLLLSNKAAGEVFTPIT